MMTEFNNETLREAVQLWFTNKPEALEQFGQIKDWNTKNVTDVSQLFADARAYDQTLSWTTQDADQQSFNIINVLDMSHMFDGATSFAQELTFQSKDIVTTDMFKNTLVQRNQNFLRRKNFIQSAMHLYKGQYAHPLLNSQDVFGHINSFI